MTQEGSGGSNAERLKPAHYKRKRYWVMPKLQARFVAWLVAVSAVTGTTVTLAIFLVTWSPLADSFVSPAGTDSQRLFWQASLRVLISMAVLVIAFGLVALVTGVIVSHRVAGPLYRMSSVAQHIAQGQYAGRIELRQSDYLHDFADRFNEIRSHLDELDSSHRMALSKLHDELSDLASTTAGGEMKPDELERRLQNIIEMIRKARMEHLSQETEEA